MNNDPFIQQAWLIRGFDPVQSDKPIRINSLMEMRKYMPGASFLYTPGPFDVYFDAVADKHGLFDREDWDDER